MAASPKAVIEAVKGNAFVTREGRTEKLSAGDYLYDFDEVFSEVGSQVTFADYYDHKYHMSGSGYVSILNKIIELKGGYLWVQTQQPSASHFHIQTVNATAAYSRGEFIISYDQDSGKTQLLSIDGTHLFSNNENNFLKEEVSAGKFSFVSEKYENGAPRVPTPIGASTYSSVVSLYDGIKPLDKQSDVVEDIARVQLEKTAIPSAGRNIASTPAADSSSAGTVIILKKTPMEDREDKLKAFYKNQISSMEKKYKKVPKKFKPDYSTKSEVAIKVYRVPSSSSRVPASVDSKTQKKAARMPASMTELNPQVEISNDAFEKSLIDQYKKQMRHSNEINSLIKDLKSYDQDYKQAY
ncbi:hypothetical protein M900_2382 [Bacteriovorax sp. Seq25_V]|nr:hypothetical protein M900_2382 [Bacteriovorax sp. Seq25_V]